MGVVNRRRGRRNVDQPEIGLQQESERTRFVIVTTQRSGSTLLVQALRSHPEVRCYHEIFATGNRNFHSFRSYLQDSASRRLIRWFRPIEFIRDYLERLFASDPDAKATGFKLMYNHLRRHPQLLWLFRRMEVKIIHLVRENVLKTHVSAVSARERRIFHSREQAKMDPIIVPTAELIDQLDRRVRSIERHRRRLRRFSTLEVSYEAFVANREEEARRVLDFLGVDPTIPLQTQFVKLNPDRLEDVILNYPAVERHLEGTPYQELLRR